MIKIVFFGTPEFSAQVLDFLRQKHDICIKAIISNPDRPKGRKRQLAPTPVKALAQVSLPGVPIIQPEKPKGEEFYQKLRDLDADIFVVVAYGAILTTKLIDIPRLACINLHTSLLPKYRGAAPIQRAIQAGETERGVSIMHVVKEFDAGHVIRKVRIPITEETNFTKLEQQMLLKGREELYLAIQELAEGKDSRIEQDHSQMTYAHKIQKEDLKIDLNRSAIEVGSQIRAFSQYPGAHLEVLVKGAQKKLKVLEATCIDNDEKVPAGSILASGDGELMLKCKQGAIEIKSLQLEGKKQQNTDEFLRGYPIESLNFLSLLQAK